MFEDHEGQGGTEIFRTEENQIRAKKCERRITIGEVLRQQVTGSKLQLFRTHSDADVLQFPKRFERGFKFKLCLRSGSSGESSNIDAANIPAE